MPDQRSVEYGDIIVVLKIQGYHFVAVSFHSFNHFRDPSPGRRRLPASQLKGIGQLLPMLTRQGQAYEDRQPNVDTSLDFRIFEDNGMAKRQYSYLFNRFNGCKSNR
jgi:hypothetical protein